MDWSVVPSMSIGPPEPDDLDSCLASSSVVAMVTPSSGLQVIGAQEEDKEIREVKKRGDVMRKVKERESERMKES